jgi:hypothetical protein
MIDPLFFLMAQRVQNVKLKTYAHGGHIYLLEIWLICEEASFAMRALQHEIMCVLKFRKLLLVQLNKLAFLDDSFVERVLI